jgi:hypothetical protein
MTPSILDGGVVGAYCMPLKFSSMFNREGNKGLSKQQTFSVCGS